MTDKLYDVKLNVGFNYTEAGADPEGTPRCKAAINVEYFGMKYCHVVGVETAVIGVLNNLNAAGNMKCEEDLPPAEVEKQRAAMRALQGRMEG